MITFISAYPNAANEKDGMIQRVVHIDKLCVGIERRYLSISFLRRGRCAEKVAVDTYLFHLNFFFNFFTILSMVMRSDVVYCHSIYNAVKILPFLLLRRDVVIDMHGAVPEELLMMKKPVLSIFYAFVERYVLWRVGTLVCVTKSMVKHFSDKSGARKANYVVLPIMSQSAVAAAHAVQLLKDEKNNVAIYSGGAQAWQNIDLMLKSMASNPKFSYCLLSPESEILKRKISYFQDFPACSVLSVSPEEVGQYYRHAKYGFLLRDDNAVNRVACPTKCIEYISNGIIPILKTPHIGDFHELGLQGVTWEDFSCGNLPEEGRRLEMVRQNYCLLDNMYSCVESGSKTLVDIFHGSFC